MFNFKIRSGESKRAADAFYFTWHLPQRQNATSRRWDMEQRLWWRIHALWWQATALRTVEKERRCHILQWRQRDHSHTGQDRFHDQNLGLQRLYQGATNGCNYERNNLFILYVGINSNMVNCFYTPVSMSAVWSWANREWAFSAEILPTRSTCSWVKMCSSK